MTKAPLGQQQTEPNPTDRAKGGVKRSLLVEGHGLPIGLAVAGANHNDFKMGRATRDSIPIDRPQPTEEQPQHLCLDKGYDYDEGRELGKEFGYTLHIRPRNEEAQAINVPGLHTEPRACWNRRKMPGLHVRENSFSCQYLMWKGTANPYRFACGAPQLPA